jgi:hypothetical protein
MGLLRGSVRFIKFFMSQGFIELTYTHDDIIPLELYSKALHQYATAFQSFCKSKYGRDDLTLGLYEVEKSSKIFRYMALTTTMFGSLGGTLTVATGFMHETKEVLHEFKEVIEALEHFAKTSTEIYDHVIEDKDPTTIPHVDNKIAKEVCSTSLGVNGNRGDKLKFAFNKDGKNVVEKNLAADAIKQLRKFHDKNEKTVVSNVPVNDLQISIAQINATKKFKATSEQFKKPIDVELSEMERIKIINLKVGELFDKGLVIDGILEFKDGKPAKLHVTQIKSISKVVPLEEDVG